MQLNRIIFAMALIWIPSSCAHVTENRKNHRRITDMIHNSYYRRDPPFRGNTLQIPISIEYSPIAILDIDEVKHIFTYTAYFEVNWVDVQLSWNSSEYGNLTSVVIQSHSIWMPHLFIANGVERFDFLDSSVETVIYSDGNVFAHVPGVFKTTCTVDVTRYPFDTQVCSLAICSTPVDNFTFKTKIINIPFQNYFSPESEWILLNISADVVEMKDDIDQTVVGTYVKFFFIMKRKSMFYVVTTIIPMFLMSVLTSFVFLIPVDKGDKMSYLVSIFLSFAVFLNFITQNMPISSEGDSLFEVYFIFVLVHCSLAMLFTLVTINIDHYKTNMLSKVHTKDDNIEMKYLNPKDGIDSDINSGAYEGKAQNNKPRLRTLEIILFFIFFAMTIACPTILILY